MSLLISEYSRGNGEIISGSQGTVRSERAKRFGRQGFHGLTTRNRVLTNRAEKIVKAVKG